MGLGGTPLFGLCRYVQPPGYGFELFWSEKGYGIDFDHSEIGYVFHTSWALGIFRFPGICDTTQAFSRVSARTSQNFQTFPLLSFRRDRKSILYQPLHKLRHE